MAKLKFYMLIGVPGSGKSTWTKTFLESSDEEYAILSTDGYIEREAQAQGKTYNDVFKSAVKAASQNMETDLAVAVKTGLNIIWDQTNLTHGSRAKKLKEIPSSQYEKIAVVFMTPPDLDARLASRPGKTIPMNVIKQMLGSFEMPTLHEGFSKIIVARNT